MKVMCHTFGEIVCFWHWCFQPNNELPLLLAQPCNMSQLVKNCSFIVVFANIKPMYYMFMFISSSFSFFPIFVILSLRIITHNQSDTMPNISWYWTFLRSQIKNIWKSANPSISANYCYWITIEKITTKNFL